MDRTDSIRPKGWNTWDVKCLNAVVLLPETLEVRFCLFNPNKNPKEYLREFRWRNMGRLGPHAPDGSYAQVQLKYREYTYSLEYASEAENLVCKIVPEKLPDYPKWPHILAVEVFFRWDNKPGNIISKSGNRIVIKAKNKKFILQASKAPLPIEFCPADHPNLAFEFIEPVYISCSQDKKKKEGKRILDRFIREKRERYLSSQVKSSGFLKDSAQAITMAVVWNTIWEPQSRRICTPLSREWAWSWAYGTGYLLAEWDTFFVGLLASLENKGLAYANIEAMLNGITKQGFVPNVAAGEGGPYRTEDRSEPPVGGYCVWKLYRHFREKRLLEDTYPRLLRWHDWWFRARDGNGDGLLELGSTPYPGTTDAFQLDNLDAAKLESGMDNSPMYDDVKYNPKTHTMKLVDVGLNSLFALDSWCLAQMAQELDRKNDAKRLLEEYEAVKQKINKKLWCEKKGIYLNRHWDGRFSYRLSPTLFYPLLAGIPTIDQAKSMVKKHLLDKKTFWGKYVIPSISRDDPAYRDNNYWRGRIWPPLNFLVYEGLKRYRFEREAHELGLKSVDLFIKEWKKESHIHENYNAETGQGDDVRNSDPVYHWGALLAYIGISELIGIEPLGAVRFGNIFQEEGLVENYRLGKDLYSVKMKNNLLIKKNNKVIIESDQPVCIRDFTKSSNRCCFSFDGSQQSNLAIHEFRPGAMVTLEINNKFYRTRADSRGGVKVKLI